MDARDRAKLEPEPSVQIVGEHKKVFFNADNGFAVAPNASFLLLGAPDHRPALNAVDRVWYRFEWWID